MDSERARDKSGANSGNRVIPSSGEHVNSNINPRSPLDKRASIDSGARVKKALEEDDDETLNDAAVSRPLIEESLVQLVISEKGDKGYPVCLGTVILSDGRGSLVLTAAHCVSPTSSKNIGHTLSVQKLHASAKAESHSEVDRGLHSITEVFRHPRFTARLRTPLYDLALLRVPSLRTASVASIFRLQSLAKSAEIDQIFIPRVITNKNAITRVLWQRAFTTTVNSLFFGIRASEATSCRGLSGAPIIIRKGKFSAIVAIVSRGPRDCKGESTASVASSAYTGFIDEVEKGRDPKRTTQNCQECQAELAYIAGPCVTPMMRCYRDRACSRSLELLNERYGNDREHKTERFDIERSRTEPNIEAVLRCICYTTCREPCSELCATHSG